MVYVDKAQNKFRSFIMCHMLADTVEELHTMADQIGLNRGWFQPVSVPHYDLSQSKRQEALEHGAIEIGREKVAEIVRRYRSSMVNSRIS